MFRKISMPEQPPLTGFVLVALACVMTLGPAAASPWNTPEPVTGAQQQDPSESGTGAPREDEPDAGQQDEDAERGREGGEASPPGDDFGCPIQDQDSFEMII
jgi:hypothetical protein